MRVQCESDFLDAALSGLMQEREATGDLRLTNEYHALTDAAYRLDLAARAEAFQQIHRRLFRQWNLTASIEAAFAEFPELRAQVQTLWVVRAPGARDEGADLQFPARTAAILRLLPGRLLDPPSLGRFLRHELTHLSDMLDPTFAHDHPGGIPGVPLAEEPLIRNRYRLLWDITIDARLIRAGRETVANEAQRRSEFDAQYREVPAPLVEKAFRRTWDMPRPSHPQLLEMATEPGQALFEAWEGTMRSLPGSRCPLCRFPSPLLRQEAGDIPAPLAEQIQRDFPEWRVERGACERCLEGYAVGQKTP